jgi:signal transduction histidine kinase
MMKYVKSAETPFLADIFAISFRWLILSGFVVSLALAGQLYWTTLLLLGIPAAWNMFVVTLATLNRRLPAHRLINVSVDLACAMLMFIASGGITGPLIWSGFLAVSSAGMYYGLRGALLVSVVISLMQTAYTYVQSPQDFSNVFLGTLLLVNLTAGLVTGLLSLPLLNHLRNTYQNIIRQRKESESRVQRAERERMKALFQITETLSGTLNYQTVLQSTLDGSVIAIGASLSEAKSLLSAFLLFDEGKLHMLAARGFTSRDQNTSLPANTGVLYEVLHTGNPKLTSEPGKDPELCELVGLQETNAVFILPLIRGLNAFGVLLFAYPELSFFTSERCDMLEMVSNQAVIAIQNARLFQDLALEKERIVQTQEDAQKKLARDLHDGPTQLVAAIAMRLNIARKLLERDPIEAAEEIQKIEDLARRTTQEIRLMLFTLRPLVLETEGLEAALSTIAEKMHDLYLQNIQLDIDSRVVLDLDLPKQTVIFYLCEEAVNNSRKHAMASEIKIRIKYVQNEPNIALLEINDNGIGFDMKQVMGTYERRGSLGMVNLRERSELINALLKIESTPGKGTRIHVFIPLNQEAIDRLHRIH